MATSTELSQAIRTQKKQLKEFETRSAELAKIQNSINNSIENEIDDVNKYIQKSYNNFASGFSGFSNKDALLSGITNWKEEFVSSDPHLSSTLQFIGLEINRCNDQIGLLRKKIQINEQLLQEAKEAERADAMAKLFGGDTN